MPRVIVVVPTYNEAENLPRIIEQVLALPVSTIEVLVVDDNSPDGTGKIADDLAAQNAGRVHTLHRAGKQGLGTAYLEGFKWALDQGAEIVVQMDADFSHDPKFLPQLIEAAEKGDGVIGSRYVKGGKLDERWGVGRRFLSWWANSIWVGGILRTSVKDNTGGFRAWRRATLIGMGLSRIRSTGYIFQVEITY